MGCLATACASSAPAPSSPNAVPSQPSHGSSSPTSATPPPRQVPHVIVILEENRSVGAVLGSSSAPYVNQLAQTYGVAEASFGQSHPSLPNYLELISGSLQGVGDDGTGYRFAGPTLVDQLAAKGVSWRAYMEDLPSPCYDGPESGGYAKKHDPFMYFSSITGMAAQCDRVVPYTQLGSDLRAATVPAFVWITPNLCHDGHDCGNATMDAWLHSNLPPLLSSAWFAEDGVAIITWDEGEGNSACCSGAHGGRILTIVISTRVHGHVTSDTAVDHAGVLRSVEQLYSLPPLGGAACACSGDVNTLIG
jgi:phospholipase C